MGLETLSKQSRSRALKRKRDFSVGVSGVCDLNGFSDPIPRGFSRRGRAIPSLCVVNVGERLFAHINPNGKIESVGVRSAR